jgi:hypothetical protein
MLDIGIISEIKVNYFRNLVLFWPVDSSDNFNHQFTPFRGCYVLFSDTFHMFCVIFMLALF